jgi:Rhs element Vgr protein
MSEPSSIPSNQPKSVSTFSIMLDGNKMSDQFKVLSIVVHNEINSIAKATILLQDGSASEQGFSTSNSDELIPGKKIEIKAGYATDEETIFKGIIIKHGLKVRKSASVLAIECRHEAIKLTTTLKNNYFHELTDSEIADQICRGNGLTIETDTSEIKHKEIVQFNCTDWDFMLCRAEENGFWVITDEGIKLKFKSPDFTQSPTLTLAYGSTIKEMDIEIDARNQYESVKSISWNPADQAEIHSEAQDPSVPAVGNIPSNDLAKVTNNTLKEIRHSGLSESELQVWANSQFKKQKLSKIRGSLKIDGIHTPLPGHLIELQNVGERFEGKVMISGVRHHIEKSNWETFIQMGDSPVRFAEKFKLEQPLAAALNPAAQGLQIGVVTNLEDPDGEERIQVRLPMVHQSDEGAWMRLGTLDAGNNRGWVFRPEVDDEVVVGFLNSDPRFGIILGKLHSSKNAAPITASNNNHEKGYVSRSEMKMVFDDDKKIITIETPGGHKAILNDEETSITLEDSNGNKLVMNQDGIEIESIKDFKIKAAKDIKGEADFNLELKAGANAKVEGSAGAELSSGAATAVKGSIVQIN